LPDEAPLIQSTDFQINDLWDSFLDASQEEDYFDSWIALQSFFIEGTLQGIVFAIREGASNFVPLSKWPASGGDPERLFEISENALSEGCGVVTELAIPAGEERLPERYGIAFPVQVDDKARYVAALEVALPFRERLKSIVEQLQWGVAWLELYHRRKRANEDEAALLRMKSAVDLLAGVMSEEKFKSATMAFVTELANHLDCDRVSIGFVKRGHCRLQSISHSAAFGKKMNLVRSIEKAMDEAILQRREIHYPSHPDAEIQIIRDHEKLAKDHGDEAVLTLPLYGADAYYGALIFERPGETPFTGDEIAFCRSVAELGVPSLEIKRQNDRNIFVKIFLSIYKQAARLFGPHYLGRKLTAILIFSLIVFFSIAKGDFRISSDATLEGKVRRVIVAPYSGYIGEAKARAGDVVNEGLILCKMDDRDLRLERLKWVSQINQLKRQYQEALADHNRAEVNILGAQLEQAKAQFDLSESKLERSKLKSPFDGIVVSGDLSQRLGGAVEQGEVLFEITPLDSYRIILNVDEKDISIIKLGQQGSLVLSSLPDDRYDFVVSKLTPIAAAKEGVNYFRVEAELTNKSDRLRPGMEGIGKVYIAERKLIYIWTREMINWIKLWLWKWWP